MGYLFVNRTDRKVMGVSFHQTTVGPGQPRGPNPTADRRVPMAGCGAALTDGEVRKEGGFWGEVTRMAGVQPVV